MCCYMSISHSFMSKVLFLTFTWKDGRGRALKKKHILKLIMYYMLLSIMKVKILHNVLVGKHK